MDSYKETFETWNYLAKAYQDKFMSLDLYNKSYDDFCDFVKDENPLVLELGCGPGNITQYITKRRPDFKIDAIDVATNMIDAARKNCPGVNFIVLDIREIDTIKKKYDAIICGFCIPYLSQADLENLVIDCGQLLNDNGVFYLSFVDGVYADSGYQMGSGGYRTYFYYHNLVDITKTLEIQRFKVLKLITVDYCKADNHIEVHAIVIAQKKS